MLISICIIHYETNNPTQAPSPTHPKSQARVQGGGANGPGPPP